MIVFWSGLALIVAAGVAGVLARRSPLGEMAYVTLILVGCAAAALDPIRTLASGSTAAVVVPSTLPGGALVFGIDALSAVFLLVTLAVGALCAVYGAGLLRTPHHSPRECEPTIQWAPALARGWFALLIAAIVLLLVARSVTTFLIAWEVMAVSSYLLIVTDHQLADVRRSGLIYFVATHTATLALFAMFALLTTDGNDWSFDTIARGAVALSPGVTGVVLSLGLLAFGVKAGVVPFHFWLPPAHSAAPSHVSALM